MAQFFITGANRGIGLEFVTQCLRRGDTVFAGCRRPSTATRLISLKGEFNRTLNILEIDVGNATSIAKSLEEIAKKTSHLDVLINNAGIFPTKENPERVGSFDFESALEVFRINAVAPIMVTQAAKLLLKSKPGARVANVSSDWASISQNTHGTPYYYGASKAALNMLTRSLAAELKRHGVVAMSIDPGWVKTDMGGDDAPLTKQESVRGMLDVIDKLSIDDAGKFLTWQGQSQSW